MKKRRIIALMLSVFACFMMCSCNGGTSKQGSTTTRDYYDKGDPRNTDRHYDNDEYREALGKAREVWDAKTK